MRMLDREGGEHRKEKCISMLPTLLLLKSRLWSLKERNMQMSSEASKQKRNVLRLRTKKKNPTWQNVLEHSENKTHSKYSNRFQ